MEKRELEKIIGQKRSIFVLYIAIAGILIMVKIRKYRPSKTDIRYEAGEFKDSMDRI